MALKDCGACGQLLVAVQSLHEDGWARVRVGEREWWLLVSVAAPTSSDTLE